MALLALGGCSHGVYVPGSAILVGDGQGQLHYIPQDNGRVYVVDSTTKKNAFESPIASGDEVVVDPDRERIEIGHKSMEHKPPLNADHQYRLYFDRGN
jgi:hypothetical protein